MRKLIYLYNNGPESTDGKVNQLRVQESLRSIFGKDIRIISSDRELSPLLMDELSLYPEANGNPVFTISIAREILLNTRSRNPSTHSESENTILMRNILADLYYEFNKDNTLGQISFRLNKNRNRFRKYTQKFLDIQFTAREERIGQIIHEQVLVPMTFFMNDRVPVHASAVMAPNGSGVLIGGTGGVGKTSLELELCMNHGYGFLADDITILSTDGRLFSNLNFPKIYGYNQIGDKELSRLIRSTRGLGDRAHWGVHHLVKGPAGVRRRVSPDKLYGKNPERECSLGACYLLTRVVTDKIEVRDISVDTLARITSDIVTTEYDWFFRHLRWHELNRVAMGKSVIVDPEQITGRWKHMLSSLLSKVPCYLVRIPLNMSHDSFKKEMAHIIGERQVL